MKTSIIIPCHYSHFTYLEKLLSLYEQQTLLPDEVIVSLSEKDHIDTLLFEKLIKKERPFKVFFLTTKDRKTSGENRNLASKKASGDILIYQDADDIPHRQRVEVIQYFFKKFPIDALYHTRVLNEPRLPSGFKIDTVNYFFAKKLFQIYGTLFPPGNPAILRKVFEKIQWSSFIRQEDELFRIEIFDQFTNILAIDAALMYCNRQNSTYRKDPLKYFSKQEVEKIQRDSVMIRNKLFDRLGRENQFGLSWIKKFCKDSMNTEKEVL